jgi:hypothetical protein
MTFTFTRQTGSFLPNVFNILAPAMEVPRVYREVGTATFKYQSNKRLTRLSRLRHADCELTPRNLNSDKELEELLQ